MGRDANDVYSLLHSDYREYLNGILLKHGADAARAADQQMYDLMTDYRPEVDDLYADEGGAMRWRFFGTGPDGPFELSLASTYRIESGRITEAWLYGPAAIARAFGLPSESAT